MQKYIDIRPCTRPSAAWTKSFRSMEEIPGVGVRPLRGVGGLELLLVVSLDGSDLGLLLCDALGEEGVELGLLLLLALQAPALDGAEVTAALEAHGGDEALNFRAAGCQTSLDH